MSINGNGRKATKAAFIIPLEKKFLGKFHHFLWVDLPPRWKDFQMEVAMPDTCTNTHILHASTDTYSVSLVNHASS